MTKNTQKTILITGGIILIILSLGADLIGIGSRAGIHWKQLSGAALGLAVVLIGFMLGGDSKK